NGKRLRGNFVLQPGELRRNFFRQDVDARREELSDLDEDAAHLDGEHPETGSDSMEARRTGALDDAAESDPREHPLPDDEPENGAPEEADDAAIAAGRGHVVRVMWGQILIFALAVIFLGRCKNQDL